MFLKQSSTYTFRFGPFIDDGDGKTVEDGYTLGRAEIRLSKDGGNFAQKTESSDSTHDEIGYYIVNLQTTLDHTSASIPVAL